MSSSPTSRRRYAEYLEQRRKAKRERRSAPAGGGPGSEDPQKKKRRRSRTFFVLFREFWGMLGGSRGTVIAAIATLTVHSSFVLLLPMCVKVAWDYVINTTPGIAALPRWVPVPDSLRDNAHRFTLLLLVGTTMLSITVTRTVFHLWGRWQMTRLTKRTQVDLRRRVFEHAVRLPLHRVHQIKSGGVASILREDAGGSADLLFQLLYNPWNAIVQLIGILTILSIFQWRMLVGALVLIPLVAYMHRSWLANIRPLYGDIKTTRIGVDAHATETFGGIRVVRGFSRPKGEAGRFSRGVHMMARQEILTWWWSRGIDIAWQLVIPLATTSVLVYGGHEVLHGRMTMGDVMMFSFYLMQLLGPMEVLASSASEMQTNLAAFDRILDLLAEPIEFHNTRGHIEVFRNTSRGRITLRDVSFAYPNLVAGKDKAGELLPAVIKDVSLDVAPGETIALVGPSGSGKTTLCNLIARFYDPTHGSIELDGVDLKKVEVDSYRRLLGIVEQDVFLFDGTVADNIGYGRRDATPEQIAEAARAANAAEFIEKLEKGYATLIGERGVRLSGGQKQRLAIARAILADPLILILDEATSNLDTESERLIQRSLTRLMRGRTCFVIAHRLSTIRHASRIAVIEDGRIIEFGSHDELLAGNGRYAEFLKIQVEGPRPVDSESPAALHQPAHPDPR